MTIPQLTLSPTAVKASHYLKPLAVCAGLALCLGFGLTFLMLWPTQSHLSQLQAQYEALRATHMQNQQLRDTIEHLNQIWSRLPDKSTFTELGVGIANLAQTNHVKIPSMKYRLESVEKGLASKKGALSFQAIGEYKAIRRFIYEVEVLKPYLFIEKLNAERDDKSGQVAFKIQIGTFFRPEQFLAAKATEHT